MLFFEYGVAKSRPYLSLVKACRYIRMSYGQISLAGSPRASPYRYSNRAWSNLSNGLATCKPLQVIEWGVAESHSGRPSHGCPFWQPSYAFR